MALREGGRIILSDLAPSLFLQVTLRLSQPTAHSPAVTEEGRLSPQQWVCSYEQEEGNAGMLGLGGERGLLAARWQSWGQGCTHIRDQSHQAPSYADAFPYMEVCALYTNYICIQIDGCV